MALTSIRSFHRLCDGLQTLALVNEEGLLVELVDVQRWTEVYSGFDLPVPPASRYESHCRATLCGGHTCLVLTPNGEIKVFSEGAQVFNFIDGRWHLTDAVEKYQQWMAAVGNDKLAEKLYRVAVNLAEERRGGLFVILDDAALAAGFIAPGDLLERELSLSGSVGSKDQLHYLLRDKLLVDLPATVIESIARIDGGIVMDRDSRLRAFGAILRLGSPVESPEGVAEGGRTTAAIGASRFGNALKVSEDGAVSFYRDGHCVWEM
jgi:DNA integrity scanning protein DisA with diadenylate cyclase activity